MIRIFKNNLFVNSLLLLPYILVIRVYSLIHPQSFEVNSHTSHLSKQIFDLMQSPLAQNIMACIILFFQAVLINRMVIQNRLSRMITLIPGLFFIIMCSFFPHYTFLSDYLIANTFIILSITEIMKAYFNPRLISNIFNSGLFMGMAVILVPQYVLMTIFGLLAVVVVNSLNVKNILQFLAGVLTIGLLVFGIEYLLDIDVMKELQLFLPGFNSILFQKSTFLHPVNIFLVILFILSIFGYNSYGVKKSIQSQRKIDLLYYFMITVFISVIISHDIAISHLLAMFIPLSILVAMTFLDIKNNLIAELVHLILIGLIFFFHFGGINFG